MSDIVEQLRAPASIDQADTQRRMAADEIERLRQETLVQSECIESLRGLLREGLRPWPLAVSYGDGPLCSWREDWERHIREALGDDARIALRSVTKARPIR